MNARQKAKALKRENERLKAQVNPRVLPPCAPIIVNAPFNKFKALISIQREFSEIIGEDETKKKIMRQFFGGMSESEELIEKCVLIRELDLEEAGECFGWWNMQAHTERHFELTIMLAPIGGADG